MLAVAVVLGLTGLSTATATAQSFGWFAYQPLADATFVPGAGWAVSGASLAQRALDVLGILGVHAGRPGFGVAGAAGTRPPSLTRADGTPSFSPVLPGGDAAGLHSLVGTDELLELAFRAAGEVG